MANRFPCPCCGYLTLDQEPPGTFQICEVCNWEDDNVQCENPSFERGANKESLNQARINFKTFGASSREALSAVRRPLPTEMPTPQTAEQQGGS